MKRNWFFAYLFLICHWANAQNAPVAKNDTFQINKNTQVLLPVLGNDFDLDGDPLTVSLLSSPSNGTAVVVGSQVDYLPNFNYTGTDSFRYLICDTTNLCDSASVFIIITSNNNAPVAVDDYYTIPNHSPSVLPLNANDYDPDGDSLIVTILTQPQHGSANLLSGGMVEYSPQPFYNGPDSFTYIVCDAANECDTATVYLNVTRTNSPPVYAGTSFFFSDTISIGYVNQFLYDPDGDTVYYASILNLDADSSIGTLTVDANGVQLVFIRNGIACGTNRFQFVLCDPFICDTAIITLTVTCPENIFLPQGFSPDGDGKNDRLVFTGLEYFAPAKIKVFNRYGSIVYESEDYKNDWDGTFIETNNTLPDGTYYYLLELSDKRHYKNYLIINR